MSLADAVEVCSCRGHGCQRCYGRGWTVIDKAELMRLTITYLLTQAD